MSDCAIRNLALARFKACCAGGLLIKRRSLRSLVGRPIHASMIGRPTNDLAELVS